jgi:hypothetical protein
LAAGQQLTSVFAGYYLTLQGDGNLVLYTGAGAPIWASDTAGSGAVRAIMQQDGNLVLYDAAGDPVWATNTDGNDGAQANLQTDGSLTLDSLAASVPRVLPADFARWVLESVAR